MRILDVGLLFIYNKFQGQGFRRELRIADMVLILIMLNVNKYIEQLALQCSALQVKRCWLKQLFTRPYKPTLFKTTELWTFGNVGLHNCNFFLCFCVHFATLLFLWNCGNKLHCKLHQSLQIFHTSN